MIRALQFNLKGVKEIDPKAVNLKRRGGGFYWVDILDNGTENAASLLEEKFSLDPLSIEDALVESHSPKLNSWGEYIHLVTRAVDVNQAASGVLKLVEIDYFVGKGYLISYRRGQAPSLERVMEACLTEWRHTERGVNYLLYRLCHEAVGEFILLLTELQEVMEDIEEDLFDTQSEQGLERMFATKKMVLNLNRVIVPQTMVFRSLIGEDLGLIEKKERVYFRDVEDHYLRLQGHIHNMQDLIASAINTHLTLVSMRMNDVIKALTVIPTLFMPLTFLTGFFGMNFFNSVPPLVNWQDIKFLDFVVVVLLIVPFMMVWWMRRKRWL